jgi:hypothetical protein
VTAVVFKTTEAWREHAGAFAYVTKPVVQVDALVATLRGAASTAPSI